ncbi:hypothetical protein BJV74DRAFT_533998 [Russula compacta]|nr:hypothetical protein BJV74DRAFT_533998 [Russula compacta]
MIAEGICKVENTYEGPKLETMEDGKYKITINSFNYDPVVQRWENAPLMVCMGNHTWSTQSLYEGGKPVDTR